VTTQAEQDWADPAKKARMLTLFGTPDYFSHVDFLWMLADAVASAAQYGGKARVCNAMLPLSSDPIAQFANSYVIPSLGPSFGSNCFYSTVCLSNASFSGSWANLYPWIYQCCSEVGWFQTATNSTTPPTIRSNLLTTDYFVDQCHAAFGNEVFPDTAAFNEKFGGNNPVLTKGASKVIALNGGDDPWQGACAQQALSTSYPELTAACDGCGHCGDLYTPSDATPFPVKTQQQLIAYYLTSWLAEP